MNGKQRTHRAGHRAWRRGPALLLVIVGICVMLTRPSAAQQIEQVNVIAKSTVTVSPAGNATIQMTMTFQPPRAYDRVKKAFPNLYVLFRDLGNERANTEINRDTLKISSDDGKRSLSFSAGVFGYAVCKKNRWEISLEKEEDVVTQDGRKVFTTLMMPQGSGYTVTGQATYLLPSTAQEVKFQKENRRLTYTLPGPKVPGVPSVDVSVRTKRHVMSAVYKVYADPEAHGGAYWVAKTVFRNTGRVPIYDLRISYKLGEYSESSIAERYSLVMPGGTVVNAYYPIISSRVSQLKTQTPVQLTIKYDYKDAAGKRYSDEMGQRTELLGINQFEFSNLSEDDKTDSWFDHFNNAPLLAAFVTRLDDAVKQFGGYISEASGGAAAAARDDDAMRWLQAAYEMELGNDIVYQTPSDFMTSDRSQGQEIKYPRDVFRDKSGTCVDLAITYAALAETVGLHANLMLLPGHCFAVIRLPGGGLVAVENTGLGGGDRRMSFDQAVKTGLKEFQEAAQQGVFYLIDVSKELTEGHVPNPELPPCPPDFLATCGIRRAGGAIARPPVENGGAPGGGSDFAGAPHAATGLEGQWSGALGQAEMSLVLEQDRTAVKGQLLLKAGGVFLINEEITGTTAADGTSLKISKKFNWPTGTPVTMDLNGALGGSKLSGTMRLRGRGLAGLSFPDQTGNFVLFRK